MIHINYEEHWKPETDQQRALLSCPFPEIFIGGDRGAGKTDGLIGHWLQHAQHYGKDAVGVFFRRRSARLREAEHRMAPLFAKVGSKFDRANAEWEFSNGAKLRLRHLWDDVATHAYSGHQYSWMAFDDAEEWSDRMPILRMMSRLHSFERGVHVHLLIAGSDRKPSPWIWSRYIAPAPGGFENLVDAEIGTSYVYIPMRR